MENFDSGKAQGARELECGCWKANVATGESNQSKNQRLGRGARGCFYKEFACRDVVRLKRIQTGGLDCSEEDLMGIEFWSEGMMVWM